MWSVISRSRLRLVLTVGYLVFALAFVVVGLVRADASEPVMGRVMVPAAELSEDVTVSTLSNREFYVPDNIVGVYKNGAKIFLMGHSNTAFRNLPRVRVGDSVFYGGKVWRVTEIVKKRVEDIDMGEIIANTGVETLIMMTCAGENNSHRLIVTAH